MFTENAVCQQNSRWRAALYLRLSRDDGDRYESESISSQKELLTSFVASNDDISIYDIYIDDGWSGTNFERPSFKRMEEDLRKKNINCIIVKDLSRFARNCTEIGNYLSILFPYLKTRFICINDNVDSYLYPESLDNLNTKVRNLINDEYCRDISIKVKSALTAKRKNGDFIGSFAPYGYKKCENNRHILEIDECAANVVCRIFTLFVSGVSMRSITKILNNEKIPCPSVYKKSLYKNYKFNTISGDGLWSTKTIKRILTNVVYIGHMEQALMENISYKIQKCREVQKDRHIIVKNTHLPIISEEIFNTAQELLFRDTRESPTSNSLDIFAGFLKCGDCQRGMNKKKRTSGGKDYFYYICSTFKNKSNVLCTSHSMRADKLKQTVLSVVQYYIALAVDIESALNIINNSGIKTIKAERYKKDIESIEREVDKLTLLKNELYPDLKNGLIDNDEYIFFKQKYQNEIFEYKNKIISLQDALSQIDESYVDNNFINTFKKYGNISELTRDVVISLIKNIYIYENSRIEISMKFKDEFEIALEHVNNNISMLPDMLYKKIAQAKVI